jgi:ribonuclease Z
MKASHILLNHFSQRYPKLPKLNLPADDGTGSKQADISISFDFMSIKVGEMWKMAYYMDALSLLFDEAEPEDGDDTTGAVEGDINPTVDTPNGKSKNSSNAKQNKPTGGGSTEGEGVVSKKAQKRSERKAAQKMIDEEKDRNGVRERSPGNTPDAKRVKMGVEGVTNTA